MSRSTVRGSPASSDLPGTRVYIPSVGSSVGTEVRVGVRLCATSGPSYEFQFVDCNVVGPGLWASGDPGGGTCDS